MTSFKNNMGWGWGGGGERLARIPLSGRDPIRPALFLPFKFTDLFHYTTKLNSVLAKVLPIIFMKYYLMVILI